MMVAERYQLQQLLGQGMMSVVWLAYDSQARENVVLKIMTAIPEDERRNNKARQRFHREIEIARGLQHPHILPIINYGYINYEGHQVPFLVSPYVREGSLANLMRDRPPWQYWSLEQTADAILQAAESLWYLHTRTPQIVHQDVKPGNFLFRSVNSAQRAVDLYLCDFGISRWLPASKMMASELLGTFAYMAPEQVERKIDCASDQYALAIMACYLLTGQLPLQAPTNEAYVEAHLHELPIPPRVLNPTRIRSPEIDSVIMRALEKKPEQRFATILEFGKAFQRAIMGALQQRATDITEREELAFAKTLYLEERKGARVVLSSEVVRPLVLDPPDPAEERVLDEPLPAKPEKMVVVVGSNEEMALPMVPLTLPMRCDLPARPRMLTWSYNGESLACPLYGHAPVVLSKNGDMQFVQTKHAQSATGLSWSPDGQVLAVSVQGEVRFWDNIAQEMLSLVLSFKIRTVESVSWSSRGQLAVWAEKQIFIYSLSPVVLKGIQVPVPLIIESEVMRCGNAAGLSWSPDGTRLAAGGSNGGIVCWSIGDRLPVWQVAAPGQKVHSLVWSADGRWLIGALRDNRVVGWDARRRESEFVWEKLPTMPRMLSISASGYIAMASSENRLLFGFLSEPAPSATFPGQLLVAWSPRGAVLATLDAQREMSVMLWQG
ncbi:MAG TPA: serine/threonine-protein kinase [Ktedonosporobacter sp.]|nr:serine/threonine-protein kinase [Ktedonosporobacter sp.]